MRPRKKRNSLWQWLIDPFIVKRGNGHQPDYVLLTTLGLIVFFGFIFLSSASSTLGFYRYGDTYRFVKQQLLHGLLPGIFLFYFGLRINYQFYKKIAWFSLLISFGLLVWVFITSLGDAYSAQSWIIIGGFSFQPTEIVKLLVIMFLAAWFERQGQRIKSLSSTTIPFVIILGILSFLIIKQPDIGTLSIITLTALAMYYLAGAKLTHVGAIIVSGLVALVVMIKTAPYRMNRIAAWLNPDVDPQGISWQIKQSLIAIGSGGWFGVGLGSSRQKSYLPHPANDSIFAVMAEEIGFIFSVAFLFLFIILIYRAWQIVKQSNDNFAKLLAAGITIWLALQVFINIGGMLKLMPLTGVPLPFVSLGGTSLFTMLLAMGILANISKFTSNR